MTTTLLAPSANGRKSQFADKKLSFFRVLRSETLKFRTLTTNWVMTLVITVVMVSFALIMGFSVNSLMDYMKESVEQTVQMGPAGSQAPTIDMDTLANYAHQMGSMGLDLGNMLIGSLAVVFIGSEYATRSIQTTITAVPRRSMIYLAKLVLLSVYTFVLGFALAAASYCLGNMVLDSQIRDAAPFESGVIYNWLAIAIYFMFMAWMGLGFGALLRNNAGGIMLVVAVMLILPIIFSLLSLSNWEWVSDFTPYLPQNLGSTMYSYQVADGEMKQVEAGAWFALWAAVPALAGYLRFRFTDAA